jgi:methyl-accepting chemotaxis protein
MRSKRHYSFEAFLAMITFGLIIGIIFPIVVDPFVEWIPGMKKYFIILCLVAGLLVGANSFVITWVFLLRRVKAMADSLGETAIMEGNLTYRVPEKSNDIIGLVARRFNQNIEYLQQLVSTIVMCREKMATTLENLNDRISQIETVVSGYESKVLKVQS